MLKMKSLKESSSIRTSQLMVKAIQLMLKTNLEFSIFKL